jgi:hypothetical protein
MKKSSPWRSRVCRVFLKLRKKSFFCTLSTGLRPGVFLSLNVWSDGLKHASGKMRVLLPHGGYDYACVVGGR